jgi:N-acetyltransferase
MFDLQPVLRGELLHLQPLRPEDYDELYAAASDPLIWEQHPVPDRYKSEVFAQLFQESLASSGALTAREAKTGKVIGWSRYHGYNPEQNEIEIGWTFLARSHWGGACNREMKNLMLGHAFRFVNRVVFLVGPQNYRSQRAMEKIGGIRTGTRPGASGLVSIVYTITRGDFNRQYGPVSQITQASCDRSGGREGD